MYFLIYSRQQNVTALFVLFWSKCIHKIYPCRISFQLFIWSLNTCDPQGHAVAMAAFWRFPSNFVWFASIKPRWCLDKQQPRSFGKSHPNRINFFFYDRAASRVLFLFAEEDGPHRLVGCVRQLFFSSKGSLRSGFAPAGRQAGLCQSSFSRMSSAARGSQLPPGLFSLSKCVLLHKAQASLKHRIIILWERKE